MRNHSYENAFSCIFILMQNKPVYIEIRSPFYKGQKIALLYMQFLVPRAIVIIEFGAEGDSCAVAKYKTTKMADKRSILAVNSIFLALVSLAAVFQCCGFLLSYLLIEKHRHQRTALQVADQFNVAMRRMRHVRRRTVCRRGRIWRNPGRTEQLSSCGFRREGRFSFSL